MTETGKRPPGRTIRQIPWSVDVLALLSKWERRADVASRLHYRRAARYERMNIAFGVPVIVLTTLVGTSLFATIQQAGAFGLRIAAGIVSVLAAILASVHRYLRVAEYAEGHRVAANRWAAIKREIEKTRSLHPTYPDVRGDPIHYLDKLSREFDRVAGESPPLGPQYDLQSQGVDQEVAEVGLAPTAHEPSGSAS